MPRRPAPPATVVAVVAMVERLGGTEVVAGRLGLPPGAVRHFLMEATAIGAREARWVHARRTPRR